MKTLFNVLIFTIFIPNSNAQEAETNINQDSRINNLVQLYQNESENSEDYQIQIYNGSLSSANSKKNNLDTDFPNWETKIKHVDTDYRVRITGIKTALEAERKYIEVRKKYPGAIIITPN
ncbi:SPOR domain-containing protein [Cellulophaga baltica]|uniref:SPOR domain-containing protein n=1 Tax=Cellulophaga TaxID=104264 RepID=UPI001C06A24A|nr:MULTISPECIES: SPOR domain-containing protein [Cellulophaga]MBU2997207.1 SPOR domain-containing protein [Cellulophaga baltica]MDO6768605.1 SPOR domain-containing protein [Cellulophaga sp. 1_MG-2023]